MYINIKLCSESLNIKCEWCIHYYILHASNKQKHSKYELLDYTDKQSGKLYYNITLHLLHCGLAFRCCIVK